MSFKQTLKILFLLVALLALVGCGKKTGDEISSFPRKETLYISGFLWGAPTGFNPLDDSPSFPITGDVNLVYESMFGYNLLTGELEGILGKEYMLENGVLTIVLNENAAWQDGTPLTSDDVMYTFELHKKYETNIHSHWEYIEEMQVDGPQVVMFTLSQRKYNPLIMKKIIASTYILPKHIFKPMEDEALALAEKNAGEDEINPMAVLEKLKEFKNDKDIIGSGPYTIMSYSAQKVALKRVDEYWGKVKHGGKMPAVKYIVHPLFKTNDKFNLALLQGDNDLSQNFVPQIWNKFKKGVGTWYKEKPYYVPGTIPAMLMLLTEEPFNDPAFRRAIAHAVDYEHILNFSIYGYAPELQPGLIIPHGPESQYFDEDDAKKYGVSFDTTKAKSILKKAGYKWGSDGMLLAKNGKPMRQLYATCPNGWTDWESVVKTFVKGLRSIGVNVREKFIDKSLWMNNLTNGEFDFSMYTPYPTQSTATPWARFDAIMSSTDWQPSGKAMWQNQGRYKNQKADSLLTVLPKLSDDVSVKNTYKELNKIFMKDLPVIPLMYRPWFFYEFSTIHWDNFPTEENPYSPPQCLMVGAGINGLWEIKPAKK